MEAYYSNSYSSSNSSYLTQQNREESKGVKHVYPLESHKYSWLHSVRKSPAKSWNKKAPVAPMPPTPVKVYKVDAINFRDVVQQLTGAPVPEHNPQPRQQQLLQNNIVARADTCLDVPNSAPKQNQTNGGDTAVAPVLSKWYENFQFGANSQGTNDGAVTSPGFLGMNLFSPTSYSNFCLFSPMSPRTVTTSLEPGKVL